jgi:hypothetical protein
MYQQTNRRDSDGCCSVKIVWAIPLLIILANVIHTLIRLG